MISGKTSHYLILLFAITFCISSTALGQTAYHNLPSSSSFINVEQEFNPAIHKHSYTGNVVSPIRTIGINNTVTAFQSSNSSSGDEKTTSLTVGYIADEYSLQSENGSYRFRFDGQTKGFMLGSRSSSLMMTYGVADAEENEGEIRTITADLQFGGNITIFKNFLGLPVGSYIPIRFNLGYRNLDLLDQEDNNTANIGSGGLGAGLGAHIRIPTGLPILEDNLAAFASLVTSVGGMGDLSGAGSDDGFQSGGSDKVIEGIRLTKNTDFNIEAKFEDLLGGNTGVSVGLTLRWLHWTDEQAEDFKQIFDVVSGEQENLELRGTQSFFRVGINW